MKKSIYQQFPISDVEYKELEKEFGKLCYYAMHQLWNKNSRNNHTEEKEDIDQSLRMSMLQAGCYYKRQVYIDRCFEVAKKYAADPFVRQVLGELEDLWENRTRHGANRQKFGYYQERLLERVVKKTVPRSLRPRKKSPLVVDSKFPTYCKQIIWNMQKTMGKRITREKGIRSGLTSLSEFDFLAQE
jgi:hypothetical protein